MKISLETGGYVEKIYNALAKEYKNPDSEEAQKSLNILCVRLIFCLYAEDAEVFGNDQFQDFIKDVPPEYLRHGIINLFKVLDTPLAERDPYLPDKLKAFPYVNGGLFAAENIEIPNFTEEIKKTLLDASGYDWAEINPTIFGAVFESTLNPQTRRSGGMHYTSVENIHKVIDPLFLDDLKIEYKNIINTDLPKKERAARLRGLQEKLASLTFLDPACGSGNFLTESYIALRTLENEIIDSLNREQQQLDFGAEYNPIEVKIGQFYGIEINDFAVDVEKIIYNTDYKIRCLYRFAA